MLIPCRYNGFTLGLPEIREGEATAEPVATVRSASAGGSRSGVRASGGRRAEARFRLSRSFAIPQGPTNMSHNCICYNPLRREHFVDLSVCAENRAILKFLRSAD
ncbi:MAG: hypothetical protein JWM11_6284 [Planctomycetaceae bacterium]|nr:hypothetical protein [Planctomycetaceae bacterium]